jgi:hypothetical protein
VHTYTHTHTHTHMHTHTHTHARTHTRTHPHTHTHTHTQGRAEHVAQFYEEQLSTQTRVFSPGEIKFSDCDINVDVAVITAGPGIHLIFRGAGKDLIFVSVFFDTFIDASTSRLLASKFSTHTHTHTHTHTYTHIYIHMYTHTHTHTHAHAHTHTHTHTGVDAMSAAKRGMEDLHICLYVPQSTV